MRKELVIGALISAVLHAGFLFGSPSNANKPHQALQSDLDQITPIVMPPIPPDDIDKVTEIPDDPQVKPVMVPNLRDQVVVAPPDSIKQLVEPPQPVGIEPDRNNRVIPVTLPDTNVGRRIQEVFDPTQVEQVPVARMRISPTYPRDMMQGHIEGEVVVSFVVTSTGDVVDARAVSSTRREFERSAVEAIMHWKFQPGRKANRDVNTRVQQSIKFTLGE